jgi:hypothetical protein
MNRFVGPMVACLLLTAPVQADLRTRAATELAEGLVARFGSKAGGSVSALTQKIESLAARHGEEALVAVRKVGPTAFGLIEAAGADSAKAVRVMALYGEKGAARVLSQPAAMRQYLRLGDEAAAALVKHPGIAETLLEKGGMPAVKALEKVTPQNGRRLAMLLEGELAMAGKHPELLEVIAKFGDRAATFVWENKGSLAVGTALTAFVLNPEPFLNGTREIAKAVGESAVRPIAEIPGAAVKGIVSSVNWTVVILVALAVIVVFNLPFIARWCSRLAASSRSAEAAAVPAAPPETTQAQCEGENHGVK